MFLNNAFNALRASKTRSVLTSLSVAVGVFSVMVISIISDVGIVAVDAMLCEMGMDNLVMSGARNNENGLCDNDLKIIKEQSGVVNAMPLMYKVTTSQTDNKNCECMAWGVNEDANEVIELEVIYGRLLNKGDVVSQANVCIIDKELAISHFGRANVIGKTIDLKLNGNYIEYKIVGVVKNGVNMLQSMLGSIIPNFAYIPYTSMQNNTGQYYYNEIAIKINGNSSRCAETISYAVSSQRNAEDSISLENLVSQKDRLSKIFETVSAVLSIIAGISLIVAGLSIMTIMTVSVNERTKEIGIKKSIGARNCDILSEFMLEALLISLFGGIIGTVTAIIPTFIGAHHFGFDVNISIASVLAIIVFSAIVGLIFSIIPAMKAARLRPVEALRRE